MADLTNQAGSQKALSQFTGLGSNDTMIHFKIETGKMENGLLGLHQAHDKEGKALEWDSENGKFAGDPAYIKDKDGNSVYKEATITLYEGNIDEREIGGQACDSAGLRFCNSPAWWLNVSIRPKNCRIAGLL